MKVVVLLVFFLLLATAEAQEQQISLLAVVETEEGETGDGALATLILKLQPGTGEVFIGTSSFAQIDTQITTKQAKEITCTVSRARCNEYDFFYSIEANSPIVKGPSAGAATAVLTVATLTKKQLPDDIALTGALLSGGVIGRVGSVPEKVKIAADNGKKLILVPKGNLDETDEKTGLTLRAYAKQLNVDVREIAHINEAMALIFNETVSPVEEVTPPSSYVEQMRRIADAMCTEAEQRRGQSDAIDTLLDKALNFSDTPYASASFCFNARVLSSRETLREVEGEELQMLSNALLDNFTALEESLEQPSFEELSLYGVIKERIIQGREGAEEALEQLGRGNKQQAADSLAFSQARLSSVHEWSKLLQKQKPAPRKELKNFCDEKIRQAQESFQSAKKIVGPARENALRYTGSAEQASSEGDYGYCVYKAQEERARIHYFITLLSVERNALPEVLELKQQTARQQIAKEQKEGFFPLVAYTFLTYAEALAADNATATALLFTEQVLELLLLEDEVYEQEQQQQDQQSELVATLVLAGNLVGLGIWYIIRKRKDMRKKPKKMRKHFPGLKR